jgi:hypothetical protein
VSRGRVRSSHVDARAERRDRRARAPETVQQLVEEHHELEARELNAEAVVPPVAAEGHVLVRAALDIEALRVLEDALVAVAGGIEEQQPVALADLLPTELRIARGRPIHVLDRRHPAQHLLDGTREQRAVRAQ